MDQAHPLPTSEIHDHALLRDRTILDPAPLAELARSIAADGLRQPIEVWTLSTPTGPHRYGLISGLRRLTATRRLGHPTIPAFLRTPASIPAAMAAMIAENDLRTDPSAWERGATLATAVEHGLFATLDDAVAALHPTATKQKRTRLRSLALVADELTGCFSTPELLSQSQIERLAAAIRSGLTPLIHQILLENSGKSLPTQWAALLPTLTEAQTPEAGTTPHPPGRPRKLLHLRQGLTIRREKCLNGYALKFTGPEARKGGLIDDVLDHVERMFQVG